MAEVFLGFRGLCGLGLVAEKLAVLPRKFATSLHNHDFNNPLIMDSTNWKTEYLKRNRTDTN